VTDSSSMDTFTFLWDFGDGQVSTLQNPTHIYADNGTYNVTLLVRDDDGGSNVDATIAVITNSPPEIESVDMTLKATEGQLFILKINATDAEGDSISFQDNSEMFIIDPISGLIEFIPENHDVGTHEVRITVSDDDGGSSELTISIEIANQNDPPELEDIGPQVAVEDEQFILTVYASDPDTHDTITFSDDTELFDINRHTGVISFTPTNDQVGIKIVTITVTDSAGEKDEEMVTFTILNINDPPILDSIPNQKIKVGDRFTYTVSASDDDDAVLIFSDDSELFIIDPITGTISFIPKEGDEGFYLITITATDSHGENDTKTMAMKIKGLPEEEPEPDWLSLILLILLIIVILLLLLYLLWYRKREGTEEIEEAEEDEEIPSQELADDEEDMSSAEKVKGNENGEELDALEEEEATSPSIIEKESPGPPPEPDDELPPPPDSGKDQPLPPEPP
ncbi:MAG: PKD domain-containing protein, partial [Methanomassiliicoccales archaeon]